MGGSRLAGATTAQWPRAAAARPPDGATTDGTAVARRKSSSDGPESPPPGRVPPRAMPVRRPSAYRAASRGTHGPPGAARAGVAGRAG